MLPAHKRPRVPARCRSSLNPSDLEVILAGRGAGQPCRTAQLEKPQLAYLQPLSSSPGAASPLWHSQIPSSQTRAPCWQRKPRRASPGALLLPPSPEVKCTGSPLLPSTRCRRQFEEELFILTSSSPELFSKLLGDTNPTSWAIKIFAVLKTASARTSFNVCTSP